MSEEINKIVEKYKKLIREAIEYRGFSHLKIDPEEFYHLLELHDENSLLKSKLEKAKEALEFYADVNNWKDTWKEKGIESEHFKYFYMLRQRTDDFENLSTDGNHHYYAGKRAREVLSKLKDGENA